MTGINQQANRLSAATRKNITRVEEGNLKNGGGRHRWLSEPLHERVPPLRPRLMGLRHHGVRGRRRLLLRPLRTSRRKQEPGDVAEGRPPLRRLLPLHRALLPHGDAARRGQRRVLLVAAAGKVEDGHFGSRALEAKRTEGGGELAWWSGERIGMGRKEGDGGRYLYRGSRWVERLRNLAGRVSEGTIHCIGFIRVYVQIWR
jgi:hypothetical protein